MKRKGVSRQAVSRPFSAVSRPFSAVSRNISRLTRRDEDAAAFSANFSSLTRGELVRPFKSLRTHVVQARGEDGNHMFNLINFNFNFKS
jgi:hypothetical protein